MNRNACSGGSKIEKATLLAIMGYSKFTQAPMGEPSLSEQKREKIRKVIEDNGGNYNRAAVVLGISASSLKRWVKAWEETSPSNNEKASPNRTRRFYEGIECPWSTRSFDPQKREVCIDLEAKSGTRHLSYTIPDQKPAGY